MALEETLTKWVNAVLESRPDLTGCFDAVAIDGKTMCASQKSGATTSHGLSVVSHELGITLTQQVALDAGDAAWRRCLLCPKRCWTTSYGCFAKDGIISIPICRDNAYS